MEKLNFEAAIPQIQTAISCGDDCDRLKLDCYNLDINTLKTLKGKRLLITIEETN